MPEACFLCLDSTEYMRNGDYFPNRMFAMMEVVNLLVSAKTQINAENTIGYLTTGGTACTVFESLTMDMDRVLSSLASVSIKGKVCHFSAALRIAALALSHRSNPRAEKRIVIFVGSPLRETEKELESLAKKLRKDDVAVDVVNFGAPENVELLNGFVAKVSKQENSFFINVSEGSNLTEALMDSRVFTGPDSIPTGETGGGGDANPGHFGGFQMDPNADPDLQMALRLSMEEEWQRQQQQAAATGAAPPPPLPPAQPPAMQGMMGGMSYEEELRRAIELSLQEAMNNPDQAPAAESSAGAPASGASNETQQNAATENEEDNDEEEQAFLRELQMALEQSKKNNEKKDEE